MRNLILIPNISSSIPPIIDIVDQLPKKSAWEPIKKRNIVKGKWDGTYHTGFRDPNDIDTIVIHHSGPPNGALESHARYHANKWGGGIAYHIGIDQGMIKQLNDLRSFTFHTAGHNTYTVAIMINRDLTNNDLTDRERELLYAAILSVKAVLPIKYIKGHRELSPTACPQTSEKRIRSDIMTAEQEMERSESPQKKEEIAYRMANHILYLQNMSRGKTSNGSMATDGQKSWALAQLLKLQPEFDRLGFLK